MGPADNLVTMKIGGHPQFNKVVFHLLGIFAIYTMCYFFGRGVEPARDGGNVRYYNEIAEAADAYDIHPALIAAVIHAESNFNPKAVSNRGAKGLMQINAVTQRHLNLKDAYDPEQNIHAGSRYLKELLNSFGGNLVKAIAAYNAGPGAVARHGGVPPYRQTHDYVRKVLAYYDAYRLTLVSVPLLS